MEELKFIKSFKDLRIFFRKMEFVMPRMIGRLDRYHSGPPSLQIEPTNYCNADCISCPSSRSSRKRGHMDIELFYRIINDASQIGVKRINLFLHGEPFLHPQIIDMIRYIKQKNLSFNITTNGVPLNEKKIEEILASGINSADYISFSILGSSKEVHESIMRGGNYDRTEVNLRSFLDQRRKKGVNGPVIETTFYTMNENEHEEKEYIEKWRGVVDHVIASGRISESFSYYKLSEESMSIRTQTCSHLWQKMTIFWDGDVTICNQDVDGDWTLGNLNNHSIIELWNSEKLLSIKRAHKENRFNDLPLCINCDM
jgi:radical SAM protein with 4Fe4S-binding SPASM domain